MVTAKADQEDFKTNYSTMFLHNNDLIKCQYIEK